MLTRGGRTCCTFHLVIVDDPIFEKRFVLVLHQTSGRYHLTKIAFLRIVEVYSIDDFPLGPSIFTTSSFLPR